MVSVIRFLDFDGVLHHENITLKKKPSLLHGATLARPMADYSRAA